MPLTASQMTELLALAKQAALSAGKIINDNHDRAYKQMVKSGGDSLASTIVTEIDLLSEAAILQILTPTLQEYQLGLLTEESTDDASRFENDFFWCIDPLDGTLQFTRAQNGYSVSIALVSKIGQAEIGVVYDPRNHNLYHALRGHGAYKNDLPFAAQATHRDINIISGEGAAVMQALATLESAPAIFYKRPKLSLGGGCLWDYAATSIIHSEAGGHNSDFYLNPMNLNARESVYMNHCGVCYSVGLSQAEIQSILSRSQ